MTEASEGLKGPELWITVTQLGQEQSPEGGLQLTSAASAKGTTARVTDDMLSGINEALEKVCQTVSGAFQAVNRPDELVVKFGLKVVAVFANLLGDSPGPMTLQNGWPHGGAKALDCEGFQRVLKAFAAGS